MIFTETRLKGAFTIEPEAFVDERGFFARTWSVKEFAELGIASQAAESNISFNHKKGTLRGMHFQAEPHGQPKLVRCTMGSIFDVIIDLRSLSPTFKQWVSVELTAANHMALYVPIGFAHGFQTLEDNTEVFYQTFSPFVPESGRGVRWDDPAFNIAWPADERTIIARDREYPDFKL
jgi:dTDP-4-dehydrorhamnose 3,5-epimerase